MLATAVEVRQRAAAAAKRAHLVLQLLELGGERANLRLQAVEAAGVGSIERGGRARIGAGAGRAGGADALGQRFQRADHHLHVDQLLLELLDALAQAGLGACAAPSLAAGSGALAVGVACCRRGPVFCGCCWALAVIEATEAASSRAAASEAWTENRVIVASLRLSVALIGSILTAVRRDARRRPSAMFALFDHDFATPARSNGPAGPPCTGATSMRCTEVT